MTTPAEHTEAGPRPGDRRAFPGFGEDAPLDLSGLNAAGERAVVSRLLDGTWQAWSDTAAGVKYCTRPVRLVGSSSTINTQTGEVVGGFSSADAPLGVLYRPCGNRRASVCPPFSRTWAWMTMQLVEAP